LTWATRDGVHQLETSGESRRLPVNRSEQHPPQFEVDRSHTLLALREGDEYVIRNTSGAELGRVHTDAPDRRHRFWGEDVLVPIVSSRDPHTQTVLAFEARSASNRTRLRIDAVDARFVRPTQHHLVVVRPDEIARYDRHGVLDWAVPTTAHDLVAADQADRTLFVDGSDTRLVVHLDGSSELSRVSFRSSVWGLALEPTGRFSAVTTQTQVHLFESGRLRDSVRLDENYDVTYATSVSVGGNGQVLVGAHTADGGSKVLLFEANGRLAQQWQLRADQSGFRPRVRIVDGRQSFTVEQAGQVLLGRLDRRQPLELVHAGEGGSR
jgi:hypothetical protein